MANENIKAKSLKPISYKEAIKVLASEEDIWNKERIYYRDDYGSYKPALRNSWTFHNESHGSFMNAQFFIEEVEE